MEHTEKSHKSKPRKPRRDKGRVMLTPRDVTVLTWIGEQYGVRLDQLQHLLGRDAQRETLEEGIVSEGTAKRVLKRWRTANWAESRKIFYRQPAWIWLTRRGLSLMGFSYRPWKPKAASNLEHIYWINHIRLFVEQQLEEQEFTWVSERTLKQEGAREGESHYADAEILTPAGTVGVEVELSRKGDQDLQAIVHDLAGAYQTVYYFTANQAHESVTRILSDLPETLRQRFLIYNLEEITI